MNTTHYAAPRQRSFVNVGFTAAAFVMVAAAAWPASAKPDNDADPRSGVPTPVETFEVPCFTTPTRWNIPMDGPMPTCVRVRQRS